MSPTLAIVIPAYNEEATLREVVTDCLRVFDGDERLREVVIVDDLSTDSTAALAAELAGLNARVRSLTNSGQLGCVPSVLRGFEEASSDFVFFLPADGQIRADVARQCIDVAQSSGCDVVVTRRVARRDPWYRLAMSDAYNRLIRLVARDFPASDIDSVCLFRRGLVTGVVHPERASAFALVELLLAAQRQGASIVEIEIEHHPRAGGQAHGVRPREIVAGARGLLVLLRWRLR